MAGQPTLDEAARKARQAVSHLDVSTVLDTGDPAELLLEQASGAYLVVLGSRGDSCAVILGAHPNRVVPQRERSGTIPSRGGLRGCPSASGRTRPAGGTT